MGRYDSCLSMVARAVVVAIAAMGCMEASWLTDQAEDDSDRGVPVEDEVWGDATPYMIEVADIYVPGVNGYLSLSARRSDFPDATYSSFGATARFFEVYRAPDASTYKRVEDEVEGINDCGFQVVDDAAEGDTGELDWWTAGTVWLRDGDSSMFEMAESQGDPVYYDVRLSDSGVAPRYGGDYTFGASGDEAPPMSVSVELPRDVTFTLPNHFDPLAIPHGDLVLEWTGGDGAGVVKIIYSAAVYREVEGGYTIDPPYYEVICVVDDDGRFTVPKAMLDRIPEGLSAEVTVRRSNASMAALETGHTVYVIAAATHIRRIGP